VQVIVIFISYYYTKVKLRSLYPDGGVIPYADVTILRVYPKLFMETISTPGTEGGEEVTVRIVRSEKDEEIEERENEVKFCKFFALRYVLILLFICSQKES
jgi:hypothetical protein